MSNPNKRKKIIKTVVTIAVICVIGGGVFVVYSKQATEKSVAAANMAKNSAVQAEPISLSDVKSVISATGKVEAEKIYSISLTTMQEISKVLVAVGDEVKEGQTLIEYDYISAKEKLDKSLKDANISLKNSQLGLKAFNVPKTESEIADLANAIVTAEKNLYQAQLDLKENSNKIEDAKTTINDAQKAIETAERDIEYAKQDIEYAQKDVDNSKTDIDTAQKDIDNAQKDLDINKQLYDIGGISQQDYEKFQTAYDDKLKAYNNAVKAQDDKTRAYNDKVKAYDDKVKAKEDKETAYNTAVRDLPDLEAKIKTFEYNITTAEYNVTKAKRDLQEAKAPTMTNEEKIKYDQQQLQIQSCQIKIDDVQSQIDDLTDISTSPINGVVIEKNVEDGDIAKESTPLLKVADTTKLKVTVSVSEFDASNIKLGQPVTMTSDGIRDKVYTGKVIFIDPQAKKVGDETGVAIDISIENADLELKPGFSLDVEIVTGDAENAISVPITSVLTDEQKQKYVFTVNPENKITKTIVKTGVYGDMYIEIKDGVKEGDIVISSPVSSMKDGDTIAVNIITPSAEGGAENENTSGKEKGISIQRAAPMR